MSQPVLIDLVSFPICFVKPFFPFSLRLYFIPFYCFLLLLQKRSCSVARKRPKPNHTTAFYLRNLGQFKTKLKKPPKISLKLTPFPHSVIFIITSLLLLFFVHYRFVDNYIHQHQRPAVSFYIYSTFRPPHSHNHNNHNNHNNNNQYSLPRHFNSPVCLSNIEFPLAVSDLSFKLSHFTIL